MTAPSITLDANTLTLLLAILTFLTLITNFIFSQINARQARAALVQVHTVAIEAKDAANHSAQKLQAVLDAANTAADNPLVPVTQERIDASNAALEDKKIKPNTTTTTVTPFLPADHSPYLSENDPPQSPQSPQSPPTSK